MSRPPPPATDGSHVRAADHLIRYAAPPTGWVWPVATPTPADMLRCAAQNKATAARYADDCIDLAVLTGHSGGVFQTAVPTWGEWASFWARVAAELQPARLPMREAA